MTVGCDSPGDHTLAGNYQTRVAPSPAYKQSDHVTVGNCILKKKRSY